ncbi:hypothetical protein [Sediminitomix flava]|uniref:Uncharacterized protein n=1 Tax=Sediminitomix flava TaxID=379075 RepID=A0A315ZEL4_SEDFL|nr:hypothetical protein [Sediminitomix flava]PWJ44046.1 hypothetical protein BC781_101396 [Sediminitomix flava]
MRKGELYYGGWMLLGFITYFISMKMLGYYHILDLRIFNVIFHCSLTYLSMRHDRIVSEKEFGYADSFFVGMRTSMLPVFMFSAFMLCYLKFLDYGFMQYIKENALLGDYLTPLSVFVALFAEGLAASFVVSFVGIRVLKLEEDRHWIKHVHQF